MAPHDTISITVKSVFSEFVFLVVHACMDVFIDVAVDGIVKAIV